MRALAKVQADARSVVAVYGHALEKYPRSATFNTTDVSRLLRVIEELLEHTEVRRDRAHSA
jgi:hypothetical protein